MPLPIIAAAGREIARKAATSSAVSAARTARGIANAPTPGHAAKRIAEGAADPHINRLAKRFAEKHGGRVSLPEKKLTGPGFWIIVMTAFTKDLLDLLLNFTVFLSVLVILFGLIVAFSIAVYFFMSGVSLTARKLAVFAISSILEMMPFISFIPMTVIMLFAVRWMEHNDFAKKMAGARAI